MSTRRSASDPTRFTVLLVEPSDQIRNRLREILASNGFSCEEERDGLAGWNRFLAREPGVVLSAMDLPGLRGHEFLERVRGQTTTPFVFHSSENEASVAIAAIKAGADDFIVVPDELGSAASRLHALIEQHSGVTIRECVEAEFVGRSSAIARVREKLAGLAGLRVPVLVCGEPGSGRDRVARVLAQTDPNASGALTIIQPTSERPPSRRDANRTIYLDSIERFSLANQHLWCQQIELIDRDDPSAPRRIVASSSADLLALSRACQFDTLLAERLTQFTIELPALRERRGDISLLARHLAGEIAHRLGRARALVTDPAIQLLRRQPWPGNVRELETVIERLVAYSRDGRITRANVSAVLDESPSSVSALRIIEEKRQREELVELLEATGGNLAEVGRRLGMSRGAVIYRAQKFGLLSKRA